MNYTPPYFAPIPVTYCGFGEKPIRELVDGPGCAQNGGYFDKKGDLVFWENGTVQNLSETGVNFYLLTDHREDADKTRYSEWTDERRAAEREKREAERLAQEEEAMCRQNKIDALLASARAKLTTEEYDAVYNEGYGEGRG